MRRSSKRGSRSRRRQQRAILAGPLVTVLCVPAIAGPEGERVVHGRAAFHRRGDTTTIRAANNTIINYSSFDIARHETVRFVQPGPEARVLNRIQSADPTRIDGSLIANGRVYIVNRAGVYFGDGALVDVGQLYAAAGNIADRDFLRGVDRFELTGTVENRGAIHAERVALLGQRVSNIGSIHADRGMVILAAGSDVLIGERGGHVFLKLSGADPFFTGPIPGGGVENAGAITAPDGRIVVGSGDLYGIALHDASRLRAADVLVEGGAGPVTRVSGVIDASDDRPGAVGGNVKVLGERVALYNALIDASGDAGGGEILIGGDLQGQGEVRNALRTYVNRTTELRADAITLGNGGRIIVWADETTGFLGFISARGGALGGDGGFAEVSGKQSLLFLGNADMGSVDGNFGTLLIDPINITIIDGPAGSGAHDNEPDFQDGEILAGEGPADTEISEGFLESLGDVALILQAFENITIEDLTTDGVLSLGATGGKTVQFIADFNNDGVGAFTMLGSNNVIETQGANILIQGATIDLGTNTINTTGGGGSGNVEIIARDGTTVGNVTTNGGSVLIQGDSNNDGVGSLVLSPGVTIDSRGVTDGAFTGFGADWELGAGAIITTGTGAVEFNLDASNDVSLGTGSGTVSLDATELAQIITSGPFSVGAQGAAITSMSVEDFDVSGAGFITGDVTLRADTITFENAASAFREALTVTALDGNIIVNVGLSADNGMLFSAGTDRVIIGNVSLDSGGGELRFTSAVRVAEGASASLISGDANVVFEGALDGTAGGAAESISIDAGTGSITAQGLISGAGGAANATGLTTVTIVDADEVSLQGMVIAGSFSSTNALTGNLTANGASIEAGDIDLAGQGFAFGQVTTTTGGMAVDNAGLLSLGGNMSLGGDFDQTSTAGTGTLLIGDVTVNTGGGAFNVASNATIADGASPIIETAGGNIQFDGEIQGTVGGASESIEFRAGAGALTIGGVVSGFGGAANVTGLTTVTIESAGGVSLQAVTIAGALTTVNPLTGALTTNGNNLILGSSSLAGTAFTFAGVETISGGLAIDNAGLLTATGLLNIAGALTQSSTAGTGTVSLGGDVQTSDADVTFASPVTITGGARSFDLGTGGITFLDTLVAGAFDLTFTGNRIDFDGGPNTVTGSGVMTLRPATLATDIDVGDVGGAGGTPGNGLRFGAGDVRAIADGWSRIHFGYAGAGEHAIQIGNVPVGFAFKDPVEFHAVAGGATITVIGALNGIGDASFAFNGTGNTTTLLGSVTTAGGAIFIDDRVVIGEGASASLTSAGGNIEITGLVGGTAGGAAESLTINAGTGSLTIGGGLFGDAATQLASATGLTTVTLTNAGAVSLQDVLITGALTGVNPLTGAFTTNGLDLLAGSVSLAGTAFSFAGVQTTAGGFAINNSGLLTLGGNLNLAGALAQTSTAGTGTVDLGGDVTATNADISFASDVTVTGSPVTRSLNAGAGEIALAGSFSAGGSNLLLTGNGLSLTGGAGAVSGTGAITIRPATETTDIDIGDIAGAGGTPTLTGLQVNNTSLAALADGFAAVQFGYASNAEHLIQIGDVTGAAAFKDSTLFTADTGAGMIRLLGEIEAIGDGALTFRGPAVIGEGRHARVSTAAGDVTFQDVVGGTVGGAAERLTLTVGGDVFFFDGVFGDAIARAADDTGLVDLTFAAANDVLFGGGIAISGMVSSTTRLGGHFAMNSNPVEAGEVSLIGTRFSFADVTTLTSGFAVDNSDELRIEGTFDLHGPFSQTDGIGTGTVLLSGSITTDNADIDIFSPVMVSMVNAELTAGTAGITIGGTFNANGMDATFTANRVDLNGGQGSVSGAGGTLVFRPADEFTDIDVGNISGAGGTPGSGLRFGPGDLAAIAPGFDAVRFGYAGIGEHAIQVGGITGPSSIKNPTFFDAPLGSITVLGTVRAVPGGSLAFNAPVVTLLGAPLIQTEGGDVLIDGDLVLTDDTTIETLGGTVIVEGTINGDGNGPWALSVLALLDDRGNALLRGLIGGVEALSSLTVEGWDVRLNGIGGAGDAGVLGLVDVLAADDLLFGGGVYNAGEHRYSSGDEHRMLANTTFLTSGGDVSFLTFTDGSVGSIDDFQGILLQNASSVTIGTAGGSILIEGEIENGSGSGDAALVFNAAGGSIDVQSGIGSMLAVGAVSMIGDEIRLNGVRTLGVQTYQATTTFVNGDHRALTPFVGPITFESDLVLLGDTSIRTSGSTGDDLRVTGTIGGGFNLLLHADLGNVTINGVIGASDPLASLVITGFEVFLSGIGAPATPGVLGDAMVTALGNLLFTGGGYHAHRQTYSAAGQHRLQTTTTFESSGENLTFSGVGSLRLVSGASLIADTAGGNASFLTPIFGDNGTEDLFITTGTGRASFQSIGANADGTEPPTPTIDRIEIMADEIELNGLIYGNDLVLQPFTPDRNIRIASGVAADGLNLTADEIARINDGFASIIIGRIDGEGEITIGSVVFFDPVTFRLLDGGAGSYRINGTLTGNDDASLTFLGADTLLRLNGGIVTDGNDVLVTPSVLLIGNSQITTAGGGINLLDAIDGGFTLTLDATKQATVEEDEGGNVTVHGQIGVDEALAALTIAGLDVRIHDIGTPDAPGVGGEVRIDAIESIFYNGQTHHAGSFRLRAESQNRMTQEDTLFRTTGGSVRFDSGRVVLQDGVDLSVFSNGGSIVVVAGIDRGTVTTPAETGGNVLLDAQTGNVTINTAIGSVTTRALETLTAIGSTISLDRVITRGNQSYTGDTALNGDLSVDVAGGITIIGDTTLLANSILSTRGAEGDDILLDGRLNGPFSATFALGDNGDLTITGATGDLDRLDHFQIANVRNATVGSVNARRITQLAGRVQTTFNGDVLADSTDGIDLTGDDFTFGGTMTAVGGGDISVIGDDMIFMGLVQSEGGAVKVLGDQLRFEAGIASGADGIDITGNQIFLDGPVSTLGGGAASFLNGGTLTVADTATFDLTGDFSQAGAGTVLWGPSELVALNNSITFDGGVVLQNDTRFRARNVSFTRSLDSGDTPRTVNIGVGGIASLLGPIGLNSPLERLHVNSFTQSARVELGANVTTTARQRYEPLAEVVSALTLDAGGTLAFVNQLLLSADATMLSRGDMTFMGPIDGGASTRGALFARINENIPNNAGLDGPAAGNLARSMPIIRIMDEVGRTTPIGNLTLNVVDGTRVTRNAGGGFDAASFPIAATIVVGGSPGAPGDAVNDLLIRADRIEVGFFETLNAYGNLILESPNLVAIGDTNVLGTLTVNSPTIQLRARPAGFTLGDLAPRESGIPLFFKAANVGADIVVAGIESAGGGSDRIANDVISFSSAPTIQRFDNAGGNIFISLPNARASVTSGSQDTLSAITIVAPFERFNRDSFQSANPVDLDLDGQGVSSVNPAVARALAIAAAEDFVGVPEATTVGTVAEDYLREVGIQIRAASFETLLDALIGRALYEDLGTPGGDLIVTRNRLDFDLVTRIVDVYSALFWEEMVDPQTGERILDDQGAPVRRSRRDDLQRTLEEAVADYFEETMAETFNASEFNSFLTASVEHTGAVGILVDLRELLDLVRLLGLSPREYIAARDKILGDIRPQGLTADEFRAVVESPDRPTRDYPGVARADSGEAVGG